MSCNNKKEILALSSLEFILITNHNTVSTWRVNKYEFVPLPNEATEGNTVFCIRWSYLERCMFYSSLIISSIIIYMSQHNCNDNTTSQHEAFQIAGS
jgi:hypothetical protein